MRWQPRRVGRPQLGRLSPQKKLLVLVVGLVALFGGIAIAAVTWTTLRIDSTVERIPNAFPAGDRPAAVGAGITFLVVGVDTESVGDRNSLAGSIMLLRITGSRTDAQVVSLPVFAQAAPGGPALDEVFGQGGSPELIRTVEGITGIRVDHYAELDFTGFRTVTDALGGVDIDVPEAYGNRGYEFPAGRQHLDGDAALAYVRDAGRETEPGSALRQQVMVAALFDRVTHLGLLDGVGLLSDSLNSIARSLKVDDTLSNTELVRLASSLGEVSQPEFVTAPLTATSVRNGRTVAAFDTARADPMWSYLRDDELGDHLDEFR